MEILKNIFVPETAPEVNFMIKGLFSYSFFGHEVWITTSHVCIIIVLLIILGFSIAAKARMKRATEVPEGFQNVVELIVEKIDGMVEAAMGKNAKFFANYIGTIFVFILIRAAMAKPRMIIRTMMIQTWDVVIHTSCPKKL